MNLRLLSLGLAVVVLASVSDPRPSVEAAGEKKKADQPTAERVLSLLQDKCLGCHGNEPQKLRGGLDLRSRDAALRGGDSGQAAIVPGQPEKSLLFRAITRKDPDLLMPPKEKDRVTAEQLGWIREWIARGAVWPQAGKKTTWDNATDGVAVLTSGGRSVEWTRRKYRPEDLWAFHPIGRHKLPDPSAGENPIDAFIRQKLRAKGVGRSAPPADRLTFLRRATFALAGLPPTPAEIQAFLRADSSHGTEHLIDRLLASPRYGERLAQHWLDVTRYADTSGFSNDFERPSAWRYRDYVVRSFNADKPFNRFVLEQVAGDELEPANPEMAIAVGYLRMGPWEHTGMSVAAVTRQDFLDDVTHHVGVTFLGLGLRCARCHDHKFDPIPTQDYYRIQAAFAPVQFAEMPLPFLKGENADDGTRPVVEARLGRARTEVKKYAAKQQSALAAWLKERGYTSLKEVPEKARPNKIRFGLTDEELTLEKMWKKRAEYYERERLRFEPHVFTVYNGSLRSDYTSGKLLNPKPAPQDGDVQPVNILVGGALESPTDKVSPGVLSAIPAKSPPLSATTEKDGWGLPTTLAGRRLALAKWLIAPDNTLTARVIVNRVWQWHFGRGLVSTPNNFGKMGGRPTHPELLDFLAHWFMDNGWSLKKLHRLIMTSVTYQQSGSRPELEELRRVDPGNELLAYFPPRRLSAEEIRDAMLAASGELNLRMGGPGAFPEINWEAALQPRHLMGSPAPVYQPSPRPEQRNRRTIYCFRFRTLADPLLEVFNRPGSETSCESRDQTTVTPQALALFNSEFSRHRALALAADLERAGGEPTNQLCRAFQRVYGRSPDAKELAWCLDHLTRMTQYHEAHPPARTELPLKIRRRVIQEETGKEIAWDEPLDVMTSYQRDLMPWETTPRVRALADVCLVLLNSNAFLYVR